MITVKSSTIFSMALMLLIASMSIAQPLRPIEGAKMVSIPDFPDQVPDRLYSVYDKSVMILVPGGTFKIGTPRSNWATRPEPERGEATVTIGSFYMDEKEVTNGSYNVIAKEAGLGLPRSIGNKSFLEDDKPVIGISWEDADGFARFLGKSLPTEAEWEIAARGPQGNLFSYGNEFIAGAAHVGVGLVEGPKVVGTTPQDVNNLGIYDLSGNVSEWVQDDYFRDYYSKVDGKSNPELTGGSDAKSIRGGNFFDSAENNMAGRLTSRSAVSAIYTREEVGFRTVYRIRVKPPEPTPTPVPPTPIPTPDPKDVVLEFQSKLLPFFQKDDAILPSEFVKLGSAGTPKSCFFYNQSPFTLKLAFLNPLTGYVYGFGTTLQPYSVSSVPVSTGIKLNILAYAPDAPFDKVVDLGPTTSEAPPLIVIPAESFTTVYESDTDSSKPVLTRKVRQYYTNTYQPDWYVLEVYNNTGNPVEVTIGRVDQNNKLFNQVTRVLGEHEVARFKDFPGTKLRIQSKYLGSSDELNGDKLDFETGSQFDRNFFMLYEDKVGDQFNVLGNQLGEIKTKKTSFKFSDNLRRVYFIR